MPTPTHPRLTTILPVTSLPLATTFFVRLGFTPPTPSEASQWDAYLLLSHPNGSDIHLREIGADEAGWLEPLKNPFGIYVYTREVEKLAQEFEGEIIEGKVEVKEWGMREFSVNGPDGCLVRVGWPAGGEWDGDGGKDAEVEDKER